MPEIMRLRGVEQCAGHPAEGVIEQRIQSIRAGLTALLRDAEEARRLRAEVTPDQTAAGAVCAWNHFENIPTFYNWNNRPR